MSILIREGNRKFNKIRMDQELQTAIGDSKVKSALFNESRGINESKASTNFTNDQPKGRKTREELELKKDLTEGVNLSKLKMRYKKDEVQFKASDIQLFEEENEDQIFNNTTITNAIDHDENRRLFNEEKDQEFEAELPASEKIAKGWGNWTGFGVKEPIVDKEKEKRELQATIVN